MVRPQVQHTLQVHAHILCGGGDGGGGSRPSHGNVPARDSPSLSARAWRARPSPPEPARLKNAAPHLQPFAQPPRDLVAQVVVLLAVGGPRRPAQARTGAARRGRGFSAALAGRQPGAARRTGRAA